VIAGSFGRSELPSNARIENGRVGGEKFAAQPVRSDSAMNVNRIIPCRNQFAPIPNGDGPTLPAWQLQHSRRGPTSSGYTTPPTGNGTANGHAVDDDEDSDPAPNGGVATRKSDLEDPEDDTNLAADMSTGV
jgi:hypothetical protein